MNMQVYKKGFVVMFNVLAVILATFIMLKFADIERNDKHL